VSVDKSVWGREVSEVSEGTLAAEAKLLDRMACARAKHAALWRFRVFCVPVGLVSVGLLGSIGIGHQAGGVAIPLSPIVAGAVLARCLAGVTAGRVAAIFAAYVCLYALSAVNLDEDHIYLAGLAASLIAACLDEAWILKPRASMGRSANSRAAAPPIRRTPTE
jgi:hypothetical protein